MQNHIAVLMGPTGAGKSALALALAKHRPTLIINADAMQMVGTLRVLTARPSVEEERATEHALYGVLAPYEPTSVAVWLQWVMPVIQRAWDEGKLPLLVGGTGMYVKALMEGLASIPPIPEALRTRLRALEEAEVRTRLEEADPAMAARLKAGDSQRNLRALEVIEATGISLAEWQQRTTPPAFPNATYHCVAAMHPREEIYRRIDARFEGMMANGALEEVRALMAMTTDLPPPEMPIRDWCMSKPPIYRAHGVPELMAHLRGEIALADAISTSQQNTRNYAKRQMTWLRNQLPEAVEVQDLAQIMAIL